MRRRWLIMGWPWWRNTGMTPIRRCSICKAACPTRRQEARFGSKPGLICRCLNRRPLPDETRLNTNLKLFFSGPVIKTELLVVMLEKQGIAAIQELVDPAALDDGDLDRPANVLVPEADYERARQLFFAEREDEL